MLAVSRVVWCKRIKPTACNNVLPLFSHDRCGGKMSWAGHFKARGFLPEQNQELY